MLERLVDDAVLVPLEGLGLVSLVESQGDAMVEVTDAVVGERQGPRPTPIW